MPRAFLMQYKKKQDSGVIYQEADTTEEKHKKKENENIKLVMESYDVKHTPDEEEEEISVTDSEDSEEDPEENMDDLNSDDNEHFDDDEDEEECEDSDDEEINIDEISDEESVNDDHSKTMFTPNFHPINHNTVMRSDENSDDDKSADENLNFMSSQERLERNINKIGSKHSAFTKPAMGEAEANKEKSVNMSNDHRDNIPHFGVPFSGIMDPSLSVSNYWHHMSKRYSFGMPYPSFPHPLGMPGFSSGALPMESLHSELLYRQMLHNQMLYYSQQNMIGPSHPMHRMFPYPLEMPAVTKPDLNNINKTKQVSSENDSSIVKQSSDKITNMQKKENKNDHNSKNDDLKEEMKRKYSNSNLYNALQSTNTVSSSHLTLPPRAMTTSHTSQSPVNTSHLNFPSSSTTTLPSPITPPGPFGNGGAVPFGYSNMFGSIARRPRDPNRPAPVKKYKCDLCPKAFSRSNTLVTHRRIHTGEKPFKCEICDRAFRQPGNLTRHRLTHTSVKPFVCVVCNKAFNRSSNLQTHMRTHNTFRPFLCPCCGKGFQQKMDLKMHMYTHGNGQ